VAFEYAVEITYPLPEGTSVGFINFVTMVSSIARVFDHCPPACFYLFCLLYSLVCGKTTATVLILIFGKLSDMHLSYLATWMTAGLLVGGAFISGG